MIHEILSLFTSAKRNLKLITQALVFLRFILLEFSSSSYCDHMVGNEPNYNEKGNSLNFLKHDL